MFDAILNHLAEIMSAVLGGGLVALFTIPETKASKRLDAAERVLAKYEPLIQKLEKENSDLREEVTKLRETVAVQNATIVELKTRLHTMEIINQEDRALRCDITTCKMRTPAYDKSKLNELTDKE